MLNLKKTAVAVLALGSSAVFAGTMGPVCTPGSVTVPCERMAWDFGVQALYLKTVSDHYAGTYTDAAGVTRYNEINPDWGWGFKLEGSYHFSTGNDINVNWYHYRESSDTSYLIAYPAGTFGPAAATLPTVFDVEPRWDAVNFEFGQHVDFGEFKNIRFHGGAQYARIKHDYSAYVPAADDASTGYTKYDGFGPRVGMDMSYDLGNGLAIYGNGASALLFGQSKFRDATGTLATIDTAAVSVRGDRDAMVPELEGKLGAKYTFAMPQGDVSIDAGYMWVNYFDAQHLGYTRSDFAIHGPYAGLKWVGSM